MNEVIVVASMAIASMGIALRSVVRSVGGARRACGGSAVGGMWTSVRDKSWEAGTRCDRAGSAMGGGRARSRATASARNSAGLRVWLLCGNMFGGPGKGRVSVTCAEVECRRV